MWKKFTILKADSRTTGFPPRENKTNIKRFFQYNIGKLLTLIKETDKNWPQPFVQQKAYNIQKPEAGKICLQYTYTYVCVYILKTEIWLKKSLQRRQRTQQKNGKNHMSREGPQEEPWIADKNMKRSNWRNTKC